MSAAVQSEARRLAALLPPLLLEAERIANAVNPGVHGRRRPGVGETFWQFRRYAAGDPAARIDWRQSARSDRLFIREREWEAAQQVYLWADNSGSMHYASQKNAPLKIERAQVLMLALASLLLRGGEKAVWLAREPKTIAGKDGLERLAAQLDSNDMRPPHPGPFPPVGGEGVLEQAARKPSPPTGGRGWEAEDSIRGRAGEGGLSALQNNLPPDIPLTRHAHVILASDFLMPPEQLRDLLRRYAALNLKGGLIHILDPAEENLPFEGRIEMQGLEQEAPLLVPNAGALREAYRAKLAEHKERLMQYAQSAGWFYVRHTTSATPEIALTQIYERLAARRNF